MTASPPATEPSAPTTSRVRGGRSPWLIAIGAVVLLGVVVYVGVSGPRTIPSRTLNPAAAATSMPASSPLPTPAAVDIVAIGSDPPTSTSLERLGTALTVGDRHTFATLQSVAPLAYRAEFYVPVALSAPTARVEFDAIAASGSSEDLNRIGAWVFAINSIANGTGTPVIVLDVNGDVSPGTIADPELDHLLTNGYRLAVTTQNQGDTALLTVSLILNPPQQFPTAAYEVLAGPDGQQFGFGLESFGHGGFDGEIPIPDALLGKQVSVSLLELAVGDLEVPPIEVGTWTITLPKRPNSPTPPDAQVTLHTDARPAIPGQAQLVTSGFDMALGPIVHDGELYLSIVVNARPIIPSPAPTR